MRTLYSEPASGNDDALTSNTMSYEVPLEATVVPVKSAIVAVSSGETPLTVPLRRRSLLALFTSHDTVA